MENSIQIELTIKQALALLEAQSPAGETSDQYKEFLRAHGILTSAVKTYVKNQFLGISKHLRQEREND